MRRISEFEKKVYSEAKKIPRGRVSTYGAVARRIGYPLAARAVGSALKRNPFKNVPCHRVVRIDGSVGGFARGTRAKKEKLEREAVMVKNERIDLLCYGV